jgi:hypothetical protein
MRLKYKIMVLLWLCACVALVVAIASKVHAQGRATDWITPKDMERITNGTGEWVPATMTSDGVTGGSVRDKKKPIGAVPCKEMAKAFEEVWHEYCSEGK